MCAFPIQERPLLAAVTFLAGTVLSGAVDLSAQGGQGISRVNRSFTVGVSLTTFSQPIVRRPSGGAGLPVDQSVRTLGLRVGWFAMARPHVGFELAVGYVEASFDPFDVRFPNAPSSDPPTHYTGPRVSLLSFDMVGHWAPSVRVPWSLYGVFGVGWKSESYTISAAPYTAWDGDRTGGQSQYSFGLGMSYAPVSHLSLFTEVRFVPGDLVAPEVSCYQISQGDRTWSNCDGSIKGRSRLLSLGAAVRFP